MDYIKVVHCELYSIKFFTTNFTHKTVWMKTFPSGPQNLITEFGTVNKMASALHSINKVNILNLNRSVGNDPRVEQRVLHPAPHPTPPHTSSCPPSPAPIPLQKRLKITLFHTIQEVNENNSICILYLAPPKLTKNECEKITILWASVPF